MAQQPQLNVWRFRFVISPAYWKHHGYFFSFGVFKMTAYPPEGEMIQRHHYKGFWIRKEFSLFPSIELDFDFPTIAGIKAKLWKTHDHQTSSDTSMSGAKKD